MNLLLIEDNPQDAHLIQRALAACADTYGVSAVQTLTQGLGVLSGFDIDAVLLDFGLPDSKGIETLAEIESYVSETPVILLLGNSRLESLSECLSGFNVAGCILKQRINTARLGRLIRFSSLREKKLRLLRRSKEKFQTIFDDLPDPCYEMDFNGALTLVNKQMCNTYNVAPEDLTGRNTQTFIAPEDAKRMYDICLDVFQTGMPKKITNWGAVHLEYGTVFAIETSISLIRDLTGRPIAFSGISRNVTDKVAAQKALQKSEEKYRTILDSLTDGYFEVDLKGRLTFFNQSVLRLYGYSEEEMLFMGYRAYMDEDNAKTVSYAYHRIYETGEANSCVPYEIITKQGKRRYLESSASLMTDSTGNAIGFRGVVRDIGEYKKAEQELIRAKEQAELATQAKSEFLANISHEIRTPMNGIIGMYTLLLNTALTAEQREYVQTGKHSADALLTLINDILDYSKIESGKMQIEQIDFNLRALIDDMVTLPATQAHAKGLEFVYHIDPEVPILVRGDPGRLRQIIMNLVLNGVKFTRHGEVAFFVTIARESRRAVTLRFEVKDTGIGISAKDQARLFQSFLQVDGSTTRRYGGAGLGLAIARRLTQLMGGQIGVRSTEGQGTTFWFTLAFKKPAATAAESLVVPDGLLDKRILIVDDNKTNLDVLEGYLNFWGYCCDRASNAAMALSLMRVMANAGAPYDLVISDMLMPVMDGAQLGRTIKNDPDLNQTLLIMLTSLGLRGDAAQMKAIGFSAYLTKPVRPQQLFDCLVALLGRERGVLYEQTPPPLITGHSLAEAKQKNVRILLAEDNAINRKLAVHLLTHLGFHVVVVENGHEALHALKKDRYDVVLMDVQMPQMNGLEATQKIRRPGSGVWDPLVPIIAMTAYTDAEDRKACLAAGMDGYIAKPLRPEELLQVIEEKIKQKGKL